MLITVKPNGRLAHNNIKLLYFITVVHIVACQAHPALVKQVSFQPVFVNF